MCHGFGLTFKARRELAAGLMIGFIIGLFIGTLQWLLYLRHVSLSSGLEDLIVTSLVGALVGALFWPGGLSRAPSAIGRPGELITQGVAHDSRYAAHLLGLASMLLWGLVPASRAVMPESVWLRYYGLVWGLAIGLALGAAFVAKSPWLRYLVSTRMLARRHQLPRRLSHFLDWAYRAGILRLAGTSVQFRHRELQTLPRKVFLVLGCSS